MLDDKMHFSFMAKCIGTAAKSPLSMMVVFFPLA